MRTKILSRIKCKICGDIITSYFTHDFKLCSCGKVGIDGGLSYTRLLCNPEDYEDYSAYNDQPFILLRKQAYRVGYGKPGSKDYGTLRVTELYRMTDEHLQASLDYCGVIKGSAHWQLLLEEKLYRAERELSIL